MGNGYEMAEVAMVWKKGAGVGLSVILLAFLTLFESEVVSPGIALGQQPYPPPIKESFSSRGGYSLISGDVGKETGSSNAP